MSCSKKCAQRGFTLVSTHQLFDVSMLFNYLHQVVMSIAGQSEKRETEALYIYFLVGYGNRYEINVL